MSREAVFFFIVVFCFSSVGNLNSPVARPEIWFDLYTQYSPPWGGQGLNMVSDAFPPDAVVELKAKVMFQGDGVLGKPVSYAIKAPNGETYSETAFTQADGIAIFKYTLPSSKGYFGQWTVNASVDLAGTIVSDTLCFLVGWLVEVVKIDAPPIAFKGETIGVNVTFTRICMQDPGDIMNILFKDSSGKSPTSNDMLLCITVTDELWQFVATSQLNAPMVTDLDMYGLNDFVKNIGTHWKDRADVVLKRYSKLSNLVMNGITISPWSFSGRARIHANLVACKPLIACCPECLGYVWIKKGP